jgi:hypothetical protein
MVSASILASSTSSIVQRRASRGRSIEDGVVSMDEMPGSSQSEDCEGTWEVRIEARVAPQGKKVRYQKAC